MRSRNIKPGFFKNEDLAECQPLGRILFAGLWCFCDRNGIFEWRPKKIKVELLPYDDVDVEKLLAELEGFGLIKKYEIDDQVYGWIPKFKDHQNPHRDEAAIYPPHPDDSDVRLSLKQKKGEAKIPYKIQTPKTDSKKAPDKYGASTVQAPCKHSSNTADSLIPHTESLTPHNETSQDARELCEFWLKLVRESDPRAKRLEGDLKRAEEFRERESDRSLDEIKKVMRFGREDENFWKTKIPRLSKFIEHFPSLAQQALDEPSRPRSCKVCRTAGFSPLGDNGICKLCQEEKKKVIVLPPR